MTTMDRRRFLRHAGVGVAAVPLSQALGLRAAAAGGPARAASDAAGAYGPLVAKKPVAAGPGADPDIAWLALPAAFDYAIFGVSGTTMSDGNVTPYGHDGMAAFAAGAGNVRLVRNHEVRDNAGIAAPPSATNVYDAKAGAGTTTLELAFGDDGIPHVVQDFVSISGTHTNCAGGVTPWNSWITCEEVGVGVADGFEAEHGYAFDVPASAIGPVVPVPLKALGRFDHEAICVDPATGIVYETEDDGDSGFFRFVPDTPGDLTSGRLQMLAVRGATNYDTRTGQQLGKSLPVRWVDIDEPDPPGGGKAVYDEGSGKGGAIFRRLEGCWFGNGVVSFVSTDGGDAGQGQVWEYRPAGASDGYLKLRYESPHSDVLSFPDNLVVTPRGGILLCEDTSRPPIARSFSEQYVKGLTHDGRIFDFALNLADNREFAGACWSPDGKYLFLNTQGETRKTATPKLARTYAIWGPWRSGAL